MRGSGFSTPTTCESTMTSKRRRGRGPKGGRARAHPRRHDAEAKSAHGGGRAPWCPAHAPPEARRGERRRARRGSARDPRPGSPRRPAPRRRPPSGRDP
jgi:hypothetical protein